MSVENGIIDPKIVEAKVDGAKAMADAVVRMLNQYISHPGTSVFAIETFKTVKKRVLELKEQATPYNLEAIDGSWQH